MWKDYAKSEEICSNEFLERIKGYQLPVVIYGMGLYANGIAVALKRRGVKVDAFCVDRPFYKPGMRFGGCPVVSIDDAKESGGGGTHVFVIGFYRPMALHIMKNHMGNFDGIKYLEADIEWPPMSYVRYVPRWKYWAYVLDSSDCKDILLLRKEMAASKRELFSRFVDIVNLELSTYCNRKCSYCPMSIVPRKQEFMSMSLLSRILSQLNEIHYTGEIMLNFFNEPLLDRSLTNKIRLIREQLPYAWIAFNSNGDFLTPQLLEELFDSGLNQLRVTLHIEQEQKYEDQDRRNAMKLFLEKLGLEEFFSQRTEIEGKNITIDIPFSDSRHLIVLCDNWQVYGNDRGGSLEHMKGAQRVSPCLYPFREIFIAYDGTIKPCCNIYFGAKDIYGNANEQSLWDIYFGSTLSAFRRSLFAFSPKENGCKTCNSELDVREDTRTQREEILRLLGSIGDV